MTHKCPKNGCNVQVATELLACRSHWYELPRPLRMAVWDAYRGPGPGSDAHTAALVAAVGYLNRGPRE